MSKEAEAENPAPGKSLTSPYRTASIDIAPTQYDGADPPVQPAALPVALDELLPDDEVQGAPV